MRQVSAFALDQVLDLLSIIVAPHTPLAEAICQMGHEAEIFCSYLDQFPTNIFLNYRL